MGQVSLARIGKDHVREGGSITLTTGVLAMQPMPGSASISIVNAGLEGFVRAAALEMPRMLRINAVSPPWVKRDNGEIRHGPRHRASPRPMWRKRMSRLSRATSRGRSSTRDIGADKSFELTFRAIPKRHARLFNKAA